MSDLPKPRRGQHWRFKPKDGSPSFHLVIVSARGDQIAVAEPDRPAVEVGGFSKSLWADMVALADVTVGDA